MFANVEGEVLALILVDIQLSIGVFDSHLAFRNPHLVCLLLMAPQERQGTDNTQAWPFLVGDDFCVTLSLEKRLCQMSIIKVILQRASQPSTVLLTAYFA